MRVGEFCNREVVVIDEESSITEAAKIMREYHVGDVVSVKSAYGKQLPTGILTDRDVCRAGARGMPLEDTAVEKEMTREVWTCWETDSLEAAEAIMRAHRVRRLPVVDAEGDLVGLVSLVDIARALEGSRSPDAGLDLVETYAATSGGAEEDESSGSKGDITVP